MLLRKPASAAAVIHRVEALRIAGVRLAAIGHERPLRIADAAAEITPSVAVAEIERELRRRGEKLFGRSVQGNRTGVGGVESRAVAGDLAADAEGDRAPSQRIEVGADLQA